MLTRLLLSTTALLLLTPHVGATGAQLPTFKAWRSDGAGTTTNMESPYFKLRTPVWWDVSGDGHPELIFWSWFGLERFDRDPSTGELGLTALAASPEAEETFDDARSILAIVDTDDDGHNELLAFTDRAHLYRAGPSGIDLGPVPLPAVSVNCLYDSAVGDLNRDGLADVYLAMGCFHNEVYRQSGHPDVVLMNRGDGRFEALQLEPERSVLTTSVTLADVDGDGWLDVLESVDASWISGKSRLLLNRTNPGDPVPHFVPSEHAWDPGTDGMGAALGDLNADGHLDLFNTSIGFDLLMMGDGTGRFVDETLERGLYHFWSSLGRRSQWSPSFVDLNVDGRLDLLVRHGVRSIINTRTTATSAADLVYVQEEGGAMTRSWTPFVDIRDDGICFAVGDLEGDGIPDAARDAQPGGPIFWENATEVSEETRRLTVRLRSSVSASPATGAILRATCGGAALTRHITSGGKIGASAAYEAHFAWPGCAGSTVTLEVTWPSGATTSDVVTSDATMWLAEEPRWFVTGEGDAVSFDTKGTGALRACIAAVGGEWSCCDGPCALNRPATGPALVALEGGPPTTLRAREPSWLITTTPHLPTPGDPVTVHLFHVGAPESFEPDTLSLKVDDQVRPWESIDLDTRVLSTSASVSASAADIAFVLEDAGTPISQWTRSVGYGLDPIEGHYDLYPVRPVQTSIETMGWQVHLYAPPGTMDNDVLSHLSVSAADGSPIESDLAFLFGRRDRLTVSVDWEALSGQESLLVRDHEGGWALSLPVVQPDDPATLNAEIERVTCGLSHSRLRVGQDRSFGALAPLDAAGNILAVPPSSLTLRVEGGEVAMDLQRAGDLRDLGFAIVPSSEVGTGRIIVEGLDGRELGSCSFEKVPWMDQSDAVNTHWAVLSKENISRSEPDPTTRLRIGMLSEYNEILGAAAWPEVLLNGGSVVDPIALTDAGTFATTIAPNADADTINITVILAGRVLESLVVTVSDGANAPESDNEDPIEAGDASGCSQGQAPLTLWLTLLLMPIVIRGRRPRGA